MKKIAVLAENYYEENELWYPYYRMKEAGFESILVGSGTSKKYKGKNGYPLEVEKSIEEISADDVDGLIVPGGFAPDYLRRVPKVVDFVRKINSAGKPVAAICHGASLLISADILKEKQMTCYFAIKDDVINAGAKWLDEEVVVDGNLVTSRKPSDLPAFCREFIKLLE